MANRYWVAGSAGNWNDTANWSITSGGAGGASVPTTGDAAIFDSNGVGNCDVSSGFYTVDSLDLQSGYTGKVYNTTKSFFVGDLTIASGATVETGGSAANSWFVTGNISNSGTIQRAGTLAFFRHNLTADRNFGGAGQFLAPIEIKCNGNFVSRTLTITSDVVFSGGATFDPAQNYSTLTISNGTNNPSLTFKSGVSLSSANTGASTVWSAGTGIITLDNTAAQAINFNGQTVEAVIVSDASTGAITLGANFTTPYVHDCNNLIDLNGYTITETGTDPSPCVSSGAVRSLINGFTSPLISGGLVQ